MKNLDQPIFDVICEATINGEVIRYQFERRVDPPPTLTETLKDIVSGEFGRVLYVWEKNIEEKYANDISEQVAMMIWAGLEEMPTGDLRYFLEKHLGPLSEMAA